MGFWKTVAAGLVLFAGTKILESLADHLPKWIGDSASWLWHLFTHEVITPVYVVVIYSLVLIYLSRFVDWGYSDTNQAEDKGQVPAEIDPEERLILDALIHEDPPLDLHDLLTFTGLSRIRLVYALDKLASKSLVTKSRDEIVLTKAGIKFIAENNLDRIPFSSQP